MIFLHIQTYIVYNNIALILEIMLYVVVVIIYQLYVNAGILMYAFQ